MSSTTTNNDAFENFIRESEEENNENRLNSSRSSFVPRQISFTQHEATFGEIILVLLPYLIILIDIFIFFLLRGFKLTSFNGSILSSSK